jgi:tetratricopeptide (TPR) repeat protein
VEAQLKQADLKAAAGDQTGHDAALEEARVSFKSLPARSLTEPESLLKAAGFAERLNDYPAAVSCYDKALTSQAISGRSLAITQNNLAYALYRTSDGNSSATPALRRAKGLVEEAIRFEQLAPFLDTLGCINSALEDRPGAIDAYRKAIDIDPHSTEACIGLADLLSAGTPQERAEASRVLAQVDAAIAAGETVSTPRKAQLQQLRQRLVPR